MPRGTDGSYSLPSGTLVNVGQDIIPSQHNPPFQDVGQALTDSLSRSGRGNMQAPLNMGGFRVTNAANGVQPTDLATVSQIQTSGGVPAGTVIDFGGTTAPTGWLVCAGQALSRASFPDLFAAIGTAYGAPDGSTFNLPDCRGRVSAGRDIDQGGFAGRLTTPNSQTIGAAGGAQTVTLTTGQMPTHTHTVTGSTDAVADHVHAIALEGGGGGGTRVTGVPSGPGGSVNTGASGAHSHTITVSAANAGSSEAHSNVQPTIIFTKLIKADNA